MRITSVKVTSHRNGVSGDPFYTVSFMHEKVQLLAIMPADHVEPIRPKKRACPCFVINPTHPEEGYRGDLYETAIRQAIIKHHRR